MAAVPTPRESNTTFAERVGCDHTTASRLRSGHRMPSPDMLNRICDAYELDKAVALTKYGEGRDAFSAWLRASIFGGDPPEVEGQPG